MPQPHGEPLDLDSSDAEIVRATEGSCRRDAGFMPRAEYVLRQAREVG